MNVVIYARFSSHSQTEQSIEGQLKACYEYAERNSYTVIGEYIDIGASVRICQSFVLHQALAIRSLTKLPHTLRKRTPTSKVSIVAVSIV